jgi:hypothetical protein
MEFELDVTEAPPTGDQLKTILDYLGGPSAAGKVIAGAQNESDAMRRLKADGDSFERPLVSLHDMYATMIFLTAGRWWTGIRARLV